MGEITIMKRIVTLLLAAGLVFSASTSAQAIDFQAKGQWLMGFTMGQGELVNKVRENGSKNKLNSNDQFQAAQRLRLQLNAVASENLSGTVYFEIGDTTWGNGSSGGALGADQQIVELKNAYIDWAVPDTNLKFRMGIQGIAMPSYAGGSAIIDDDVAAVVANYQFNENVGLTLTWMRPYNDNYSASSNDTSGNNKDSYLDNLDLISLAVPMNFDGIELSPWIMYGIVGQNALRDNYNGFMGSFNDGGDEGRWQSSSEFNRTSSAYTSAFWAGLPIKVSLLDPVNIEFDFNYGYMEGYGRGTISKYGDSGNVIKRYDTRREGFLLKALVEYKMDWGAPGILGWYASGDDDNPKNGSERMPSISPCGNFSSFMGDGNWGWSTSGALYDRNMSYSGTWGIGVQLRDMSFVEDLTHTFRAIYWGGTNSPAMAKYASWPWSFEGAGAGIGADNDMYLTTNDSLVEFNLITAYKMYENFEINFELGYIINFIDEDTWKKSYNGRMGYTAEMQDAWKAQLIFAYSF